MGSGRGLQPFLPVASMRVLGAACRALGAAPNLSRNQSGHFYPVPVNSQCLFLRGTRTGPQCTKSKALLAPGICRESGLDKGEGKVFCLLWYHGETWMQEPSGGGMGLAQLVYSLLGVEATERNRTTSHPGKIHTWYRAQ